MSQKNKVVYLTGAPAAGKSTLIHALERIRPDVRVFEYGRMMSEKLSRGKATGQAISQHELRGGTDGRVTQQDIDELDAEMTDWIERNGSHYHLVIDSHHVTIERFGFRLSPFSPARLQALKIDEFWLLILDTAVTLKRMQNSPDGRRLPTAFQAEFHTHMQASLVAQYAALTGRPLYVFDASAQGVDLLSFVAARLDAGM